MSYGDDKTESWKANTTTSKTDNVPSVSQNNLWIPDKDAKRVQAIYVTALRTSSTRFSQKTPLT